VTKGIQTRIELTNSNNEQYIGNILFGGDTKQSIPVMFDTGSSLLYVLTDSCESVLCPQKIKF